VGIAADGVEMVPLPLQHTNFAENNATTSWLCQEI
jgi:hypothetical protein